MVKDKYPLAWINDWFDQFQEVRVISKNGVEVKCLIERNFGGCDGNVKFRSGLKEVFRFLRYLMVLRFLNDLNRLILDFILAKCVRSLILNVYLEML